MSDAPEGWPRGLPGPDRLAGMSRRELLAALAVLGGATALGPLPRAAAAPARRRLAAQVSQAATTAPAGSDLGAIEHVVFLMMENRSYDHYFGAYPRGRGFDDHPRHRLGAFAQPYPGGAELSPKNVLLPFRLGKDDAGQCTKDLTHDWGPMHQCWNHGRMDSFVRVHTAAANEGNPDGALTMGYYTRAELPYYYALADHFTLCDGYHCSILGPTHPNRVMSLSGTIDPAGTHGGPITNTNPDPRVRWTCDWPTVPELLEDKGISWKVYHPSYADLATLGAGAARFAALAGYPTFNPALYDPTANPTVMLTSDHVLPYFKAYQSPASSLYQKAFLPTFPAEFMRDIQSGTLPAVSWLIPPLGFDEHPSASPDHGTWLTSVVLDALLANPKVWSKTVLFFMYDENDGFFDHVPPPVAPKGTKDEWLTAPTISAATLGIRGPLGLGVRVPMLVLSPFSRGGHVVSETFDHTSQLRFLEERFGVRVSEISRWRRATVGDLTRTLFRSAPDASTPALPAPPAVGAPAVTGVCAEPFQETEFVTGAGPSIPRHQRMPTQQGTTVSASRFSDARTRRRPTPGPSTGSRTSTAKADVDALARTGGLPLAAPGLAVAAAVAAMAGIRQLTGPQTDEPADAGDAPDA